MHECPVKAMNVRKPNSDWKRFVDELSRAPRRALLLDYDGTLAPFRVARDQAVPDPDLHDALQGIIRTGRTRVVVISGRALCDLIPLLGLDPLPELWGCHGWERRMPDGRYQGPELEPDIRDALHQAHRWACSAGLEDHCEAKPAGIALHWRGLDGASIEQLRARVRTAWEPLAREPRLELHEFDGGLELRVAGRHKGYALVRILSELDDNTIVAYAGDDLTDEDAFKVLTGRGLSILVRPEYRETAADLWLKPPQEWLRFLQAWLAADRTGG
jgi:trehalose 6-phosphate phosphatase